MNQDEKKLDALEAKLAHGIGYADMLGFSNQNSIEENRAMLHALAELLVSKGIIRIDELEKRKKDTAEYFKENNKGPQVQLLETPDKYEVEHQVKVDCGSRMHICKAVCCKLTFALSTQDLREGVVKWNYREPYVIAKKEDGSCTHCQSNGNCGVYENRPLICRTYDCSGDQRIWKDFEKMELNKEWIDSNLNGNDPDAKNRAMV